jgi:hypothetical protein
VRQMCVQIGGADPQMRYRPGLANLEQRRQIGMKPRHRPGALDFLGRRPMQHDRQGRIAEQEAARPIGLQHCADRVGADLIRQFRPESITPIIAMNRGDVGHVDDFDQDDGAGIDLFVLSARHDIVLQGAPVGQAGQGIRSRRGFALPGLDARPGFAPEDDEEAGDHRQAHS